ncbi:hypothetical protein HPB50_022369 [Hyalomma asiaticum]|uniref:Uncharacterized protein n=1 Tax=Hyalomma asiaticum TaxID=266040 RepID=A0ACB7S4H1_HYAAI|nr:hypothetical protein HPB50_022369 [Hyalomma asiaticum]
MDRQGSPQTYSTTPERRSCLKSSSSSAGGGRAVYGNTSEPTSFSPLVTSSASLARRRRQKIIRSMLCLFAVLIGLVAALTLLLSPMRTRNTSFGVCLSESCLQYIRNLEASINPELDPCRDFHAYVCSRWRPVAGGRSFLEDAMLDFEDKYIVQALATKATKTGQTNFQKGALFYQSCVTKKDHGIRSLKEFLITTGLNWPAVNMNSDPFQVILDLSFEWRCPVFFYAYVSSGGANAHRLQVLDMFMGFDFSAFLAEHRSRVDSVGHVCQLYDALADVPDVTEDKSGNKSRNVTIEDMTDFLPHNVKRLPRVYWAWVYGLSKSRATWTNPWRQANVTYAPQKLVVPDVYTLAKVSPEGAYESVNYATVGSLIARQISSMHDLKGRAIDADGIEQPLLSPDEQRRQDKLIDCLVKAFERQYNGTEVISEEDKSALYVAWASLSPLLNALQFSPGYPDRSAGFLQYTAIQLFFISLCFQVCSQERESDVFNEAMWCNFPLRLFKPFQESFQCAGNSAMHSAVECDGDLLSAKSL